MRSVYFQPVGNPVQYDRLPPTRPSLRFAFKSPIGGFSYAAIWRQTLHYLFLAVAAMCVNWVQELFQSSPTWDLVAWYFFICLCLAVLNALSAATAHGIPFRWTWNDLAVLIVAILYLSYFPSPLRAPLTLAFVIAFSWLFARHWIGCGAASQAEAGERDLIMRRWTVAATAIVVIPAFLLGCWLCTSSVFYLLTAVVFILVLPVYAAIRHSVRACIEAVRGAIASWFTYNPDDVRAPGLHLSLAGPAKLHRLLAAACIFLAADFYWHFTRMAEPTALPNAVRCLTPPRERWAESIGLFAECSIGVGRLISSAFLPTCLFWLIPPLLLLPLLVVVHKSKQPDDAATEWERVITAIRDSVDSIERSSLYMGRLLSDGSPLLLPRAVLREHAHFLGDTGGGKTALGLLPLIEQLVMGQDCSVITIDLKADSLELLATLDAARKKREAATGRPMPLRFLSNQRGLSTFAFNPLRQPFWQDLDLYMRTDILCGALGLSYGADYGEGFYSSANAAVLYYTLKTFPDVDTFRELADRVGYVMINAKRRELHPEIRRAGVHVQTVLDRLGSLEALNVTPSGGYSAEVLDNVIDFERVFAEPELHYYHLSATLAPGASPELARLVTYCLLAASTKTRRKHQVYLVIDEFQRMVAKNIEYMLQLARSMGVSVILANQTMQDLRTRSTNLIPAIEANCRFRQWFAVSSLDDRKRLSEASGEAIDYIQSQSTSQGPNGMTYGTSSQEIVVERLSTNDILLASDHPLQSIVRISRGAGYAQYGGMPFLLESNYHISLDEYQRRRSIPWPDSVPGSFLPGTTPTPPAPKTPRPVVTTEVVGGPGPAPPGQLDLFDSLRKSLASMGPARKRAKRPRKKDQADESSGT